jgi:hypothetical protein
MKKQSVRSLLIGLVSLMILIGIFEYIRMYLYPIKGICWKLDSNLWSFLINVAYGMSIGFIYLLKQNSGTEKWSFHYSRIIIMLFPMLILSGYFIYYCYLPRGGISVEIPNREFLFIYGGDRIAEHLAYFYCGFLVLLPFFKNDGIETYKYKSWIKSICSTAIIVLLLLAISYITDIIINYAIFHRSFSYYTYGIITILINFVFGLMLATISENNLNKKEFKVNSRKFFTVFLPVFIIGFLPYLIHFVYLNYLYTENVNTQLDIIIYNLWIFLAYSDFMQIPQILSGFILLSVAFRDKEVA